MRDRHERRSLLLLMLLLHLYYLYHALSQPLLPLALPRLAFSPCLLLLVHSTAGVLSLVLSLTPPVSLSPELFSPPDPSLSFLPETAVVAAAASSPSAIAPLPLLLMRVKQKPEGDHAVPLSLSSYPSPPLFHVPVSSLARAHVRGCTAELRLCVCVCVCV